MKPTLVLAGLVASAAFAAADDTADAVAQRTEKLAETVRPIVRKIRTAKTDAEADALRDDLRREQQIYFKDLLEITAKDPASQSSFEVFTLLASEEGETAATAKKRIGEHHAAKPWVADAVLLLATGDAADAAILETVVQKNPFRTCKAAAAAGLVIAYKQAAADGPTKDRAANVKKAEAALAAAEPFAAEKIAGLGTVADVRAAAAIGLANIAKLSEGGTAPDILGTDTDGKPMKLSEFRGKVVLVDFWATWCPPCMALVPHTKKLLADHAGGPFAVVGVNMDDDKPEYEAEVKRQGIAWRSFPDKPAAGGPKITEQWNVRKYPTVYLIDHTGVVRKVWAGRTDPEAMAAEVRKWVAAAGKK